jgi:hypothetical protein
MFERPTGSITDAAPNGANERRTSDYSTNITAGCTTIEGVPVGQRRSGF